MNSRVLVIGILILGLVFLGIYGLKSDALYRFTHNYKEWGKLEGVYQWIIAQQRMNRIYFIFNNGLLPSFEEGNDAYTYDQALAAIVYTLHGDYKRTRGIFNFYEKTLKKQKDKYGKFIGFSDSYSKSGKWGETWAAGPNSWLLLAVNYYTYETKDARYLPLAKELAEWLIALQSIEGGLIGGYYGNKEPMTWIATEHNFDAYAAFRDLGIITSDKRYLKIAKDIKVWLENDTWDSENQRFYMGRRLFNRNYATDLSSWAVLSLGDKYAVTLDFAMDKSLNKQYYKVKRIEVEGFDFGSKYDVSPYPDKDAVWFEGTGQMVLAFDKVGRLDKKNFFLGQLEKALTRSPAHKGTLGLPYASNTGTPAYGSWMMQDVPLCVSSSAWYIYARENFNPFSMDQNDKLANSIIEELNYEPNYQFRPIIDDFEYSRIKLKTAYPKEMLKGNKSTIERSLDDEVYETGSHSMMIAYKSEKDAKNNWGIISRPFMLAQDWSGYSTLSISFFSRTPDLKVRIKVKDKEGEPFETKSLILKGMKWKKVSFDLPDDFKRSPLYSSYGNKLLDIDGIREISIEVVDRKATPCEKILYIDNIELN